MTEGFTDFTVENHGSIMLLTPHSTEAELWIGEHIPDDAMTWGKNSVVVEPRYMGDIVEGIRADGLTV